MARNKSNARRTTPAIIDFDEMARITGINPRQRIIMRRYFILRLKGVNKKD